MIPAVPTLLAMLGSLAATPLAKGILNDVSSWDWKPTRYSDHVKGQNGVTGGLHSTGKSPDTPYEQIYKQVMDMPSAATPSPIVGALTPSGIRMPVVPDPKRPQRVIPKKITQEQQIPTEVLPSTGNADWHDAGNATQVQPYANEVGITRSPGVSPDTPYADVQAIAAANAAQEEAAMQARYQQLLNMYNIAPGSGAPAVNPTAAQEYYQDPSIYEALSRVYAGAPAFNAWG